MTTRVLLLGATGAVGRACLDVLAEDPRVLVTIAGRDPHRYRALCRSRTIRSAADALDLGSIASDGVRLVRLAKAADVVVNCAGPSHSYSASVAAVVMLCGAAYVDPGLDSATIERVRGHMPGDGVAIVQTGVQPGLSGLALRILAERLGGRADRMRAWCGGLQPLTEAALAEYLADTGGSAATVLRHGTRARIRPGEITAPPPDAFPLSARGHAHLDDEIADVAVHFGIPDVEWVNMTDGVRTERAIGELHTSPASDRSPIEAVRVAARLDLFGRRPYFTLLARAHRGDRQAEFLLRTADSYAVTGAVTAWAATAVTTAPHGIHPLWSVPGAASLLRELPYLAAGTEVRVAADPARPAAYEEGAL